MPYRVRIGEFISLAVPEMSSKRIDEVESCKPDSPTREVLQGKKATMLELGNRVFKPNDQINECHGAPEVK